MSIHTHTPGPWLIDWETETIHASYDEGSGHIAEMRAGKLTWHDRHANARLIAAAPDLLAALEYALAYPAALKSNAGFIEEVKVAIAKAKGTA